MAGGFHDLPTGGEPPPRRAMPRSCPSSLRFSNHERSGRGAESRGCRTIHPAPRNRAASTRTMGQLVCALCRSLAPTLIAPASAADAHGMTPSMIWQPS